MKTIHQATDDNTTTKVSQKRYRYRGKERDEESGLYYYGARYYAAWLCRFVSVDPRKDGYPMWSSYVYAGNMPVTLTDVNGERPGDGEINETPLKNDNIKELKTDFTTFLNYQYKSDELNMSNYSNTKSINFSESVPLKKSKKSRLWDSLTIEPGVTNIDFSADDGSSSISGEFKFDGEGTGILSDFQSYDSRDAYFPPSVGPFTDQANRYLVTFAKESGFRLTFGVIHDKRKNIGNQFTYNKGGTELSLLTGKEWGIWESKNYKYKGNVEVKAGGFLSYNRINASITDNSGNTYISSNNKKSLSSGNGALLIGKVTFEKRLSSSHSIGFSINGTLMSGQARTKATLNGNKIGTLSVNYSSASVGMGLSYKFRR